MNKQTKKIEYCLKHLSLSGISTTYKDFIRHATKDTLSFEEFLLILLESECENRRIKKVSRYQKESALPREKTFQTFDLNRVGIKNIRIVKALLEGDFIKRKENILAFGRPGCGKTHLLCAIAHELISKGFRVFFTRCSSLIEELLIAKEELRLEKHLKKLLKFDVLFIDDIGYVQQNREEMEVLFTLLAHRYERGSIMITSNLVFSKWDRIFKDPMTTAAAIDRVVHHSVIFELNISSYRIEEAKKNNEGKKYEEKDDSEEKNQESLQ